MSKDRSVIGVLTTALEGDPDNKELRMHLASLLMEEGRAQDALSHCTAVLNLQPDHSEALDCAARAADALGDSRRASAYRRLLHSLSSLPAGQGRENPNRSTEEESVSESAPGVTSQGRAPLGVSSIGSGSGDSATDELLDETDEIWDLESPGVKLADVAGMEEVKRRLNLAFLAPLKNPEMMRLYGKSLRGGLLLYGPPGCGKTFIARATAGELKAKFISVGLSDVLDMWIGNSEKNLHEIFETARRNSPCVLFFDEIDALGRKRALVRYSATSNVVNQLLAEMDTVNLDNEGVFVLAATNHPWDVDTALRRPGRLDRMLLVLPPDQAAREAILRYHLQERPVENLNLKDVAARTEEFSGADLAHLCESAAELAMEESLTSGKVRSITMGDFKHALKDVRPSTRPWFDTARNYALFSNEGGVYDELLNYLRAKKLL